MNNVTQEILSTLTMLGLAFIFIGMPIWGIVALCQSRKRRPVVHN